MTEEKQMDTHLPIIYNLNIGETVNNLYQPSGALYHVVSKLNITWKKLFQ